MKNLDKWISFEKSERDSFVWKSEATGIRNQLYYKSSGEFVDDFVIEKSGSSINVMNYVSPGWTCAFPMGDHIANEEVSKFFRG